MARRTVVDVKPSGGGRRDSTRWSDRGARLLRLIGLALTIAVLTACANAMPGARTERVVMTQHNGWTIRITPSFSYTANRWRARAEVWPPDRNPQAHAGIGVRFSEEAWDQKVVVEAALASARRYIDASRTEHR